MKRHLNTLFITLEGAYLRKDGAAVEVRHEGETKLRVPLHNLDGIAAFGWDISASAQLLHACAENDVSISFHNPYGKFLASSRGPQSGNILLRRTQYRTADDLTASASIARNCVAAKIVNCRTVLQRAARDHGSHTPARAKPLLETVDFLARRIQLLAQTASLDEIRGVEGDAAAAYFGAFQQLLTIGDPELRLAGRSRRPPLDPVNALLSFLYSLLAHDCRSACESVGLDPQCGFLHRDRPGRPSLALDLMEELRPFLADRAAVSLLNRKQLTTRDFERKENGAVLLRPDARKIVLTHWQERKQKTIHHPFLDEKTTIGLIPHLQARLLARFLHGDLDCYPAFLSK